MALPEKGEPKATRQCWECSKRRLVCDCTLPHCRKCQKAGRQCSGYDDTKPLQWVQTGMVTSRRRKKKDNSPPKVYVATPTSSQDRQISCQDGGIFEHEFYGRMYENDYICEPVDYEDALASFYEKQKGVPKVSAPELHVSAIKMTACANEAARIFKTWGRAKIEDVVEKGLHDEAAKILRSKRDPLRRLKRLVVVLHKYEVPNYAYLTNETSDVIQAVQYCKRISKSQLPLYTAHSSRQCQNSSAVQGLRGAGTKSRHRCLPPSGAASPHASDSSHASMHIPQSLCPYAAIWRRSRNHKHEPIKDISSPRRCLAITERVHCTGQD